MGRSLSTIPQDPRARELHALINQDLQVNSPSERREYLGMSGIGRCALEQWYTMKFGPLPSLARDKYGKRGYLFEGDAKLRLQRIGYYFPGSEVQLIAPWDSRFRGHTDGQVPAERFGEPWLLELKSCGPKKFEDVVWHNAPLSEHLCQIQTYMRYGGWNWTMIVYINADTFDHWMIPVKRDDTYGKQMELRAQWILRCVDGEEYPPKCECGWCAKNGIVAPTPARQRQEWVEAV